MGANILGTADQAGLITTSIRRKFIPRLKNKLRFDPYCATGKLEMRGGTKTLRWNLASDIGVFTTALTEDTLTAENKIVTITITSVLQTVSDYGAWAPQSDLSDSVWTNETREEYADIFSYSGAKTKDTLIRNAALATTSYFASGNTVANGGNSMTTLSTAIAADLNYIRGAFDQTDCDAFDSLGGNYLLVIHGEVEQDMVADVTTGRLSWSPLIQNVPAGVDRITNFKGPGALLGIAVMRSNNIDVVALTTGSTPGATGVNTSHYRNVALADHGVGKTTLDQSEPRIIRKNPGPGTVSVPLDTYGTIGWKMRLAQGLLSSTRALTYYAAK
jgi:hypothetical protein